MKPKKYLPLVFLSVIVFISVFFYTYRLHDTQVFIHDIVRDTLRALTIWQDKELTLIGPPASFSINTVREFYFGSAFLYIGLIGLIIAKFDPVGAVLPNIFFFTLSIPLFYLLVSRFTTNSYKRLFATFLYALSPVTVTHVRFFWNPNLIIPFSVAFWYLVEQKYSHSQHRLIGYFFSGIIAGIIFNFHYFAVIPIIIYLLSLLYHRKFSSIVSLKLGFLVSIFPFLLFEIRNHFYLTQAFIYNLQHGPGISTSLLRSLEFLIRIILSPLGSATGEIKFPTLPGQTQFGFYLSGIILLFVILWHFAKRFRRANKTLYLTVFVTVLITIYLSSYDLYLRYLFAAYPLLIWVIADSLTSVKYRYLPLFIFFPIFYTIISIVLASPKMDKDFLPLSTLEQAGRIVVEDTPVGKYNLSENIHGDARATALRYFVQRDATNKPQSEIQYNDLFTLYVLSPSLEKIYSDNRWEFTASGPKELQRTWVIGEVSLYKFTKSETN